MKYRLILLAAFCLIAFSYNTYGQNKKNDPSRYFTAMTQGEIKDYKLEIWQSIADLSLIPPTINTNPLPEYDYDELDYGMSPGIAQTPGGRIWAAWIAGGDGPNAFLVAARSDDDGNSWSRPKLVIDSRSPTLPIQRSVLIENFWTDPLGRLWLFFSQGMGHYDGRLGLWVSVSENPDSETPVWSDPTRIANGAVLTKPIVLKNGEWLLPVEFPLGGVTNSNFRVVNSHLEPLRGANVYVSSNQGKSWNLRGNVRFPDHSWDEHMMVELKDHRLWMLARTKKGVMQSFSKDKGKTWTEPSFATFSHPSARFFVRRLESDRILLIKHGDKIDSHNGRYKLSAWLSEDEGKTWIGGLIIDERKGVSYPDGFQADDGIIYIAYDHHRRHPGEILMARITENDILAGKLVSPDSKLKMIMSEH